jgi:hypothetical protein
VVKATPRHASVALLPGKNLCHRRTGGWVGPRAEHEYVISYVNNYE